jgi:hypothetical protein
MFALGFADLFNPRIHGGENRDYLNGKFLCMMTFTPQEIADDEYIQYMLNMRRAHIAIQEHEYNMEHQHKMFRLKLLKIEELPTGEHICVDKTTYLRQLQRQIRRRQNT